MCFVNALCLANVRQLRPYLLLTASSGKPTLCLCSHKQNMAKFTLQRKKVPCLHCPPFQGQRGSHLLPWWCERCCPKMWHPWFHTGWALHSSGWHQWQKPNTTDLPTVADVLLLLYGGSWTLRAIFLAKRARRCSLQPCAIDHCLNVFCDISKFVAIVLNLADNGSNRARCPKLGGSGLSNDDPVLGNFDHELLLVFSLGELDVETTVAICHLKPVPVVFSGQGMG